MTSVFFTHEKSTIDNLLLVHSDFVIQFVAYTHFIFRLTPLCHIKCAFLYCSTKGSSLSAFLVAFHRAVTILYPICHMCELGAVFGRILTLILKILIKEQLVHVQFSLKSIKNKKIIQFSRMTHIYFCFGHGAPIRSKWIIYK